VIATETVNNETTSDNPVGNRALELAREWYPRGIHSLTGVTESEAKVLVEIEEDIRVVHYEDLDRLPRCEWCGRPL
jgi:hypothetical protein